MPYRRVLPRDLFNEAKVLKSYGQLALILHDQGNLVPKLRLIHSSPSKGFIIDQDPNSGDLYIANLRLVNGTTTIYLGCSYNSRDPYSLVANDTTPVLTDDGQLHPDFLALINRKPIRMT